MAISADEITEAVARLCVLANVEIPPDIREAIVKAEKDEDGAAAGVLRMILKNHEIAESRRLPICQDTGMAVVFAELGQDVRITGGGLTDAINNGVRKGYKEGYLRASVVADPIERVNTNDNAPAVIHFRVVLGRALKLTVAPKGFGSENMSALKMLKPSDGIEGVESFILSAVAGAGDNPCPPVVVGAGVGGTMEKAALMAKEALLRPVGSVNPSSFWAEVEARLLRKINGLGIGPAGLGGKTTALAVNINAFPTHIAGLPVAVNIGCHATRHAECTINDTEG
jgi:fumarate hydratase subunit alpha